MILTFQVPPLAKGPDYVISIVYSPENYQKIGMSRRDKSIVRVFLFDLLSISAVSGLPIF